MTETSFQAPAPFDFWLEYLRLQPDLTQWAATFDAARVSWRLDLCWRLLRAGRRWAETPADRALVRFHEGLLHVHGGDWERAAACYRAAHKDLPDTAVDLRVSLLGERGMLARLQGDARAALTFHRQQHALAQAEAEPAWQAEAWDQMAMDHETLNDWTAARRALKRALALYETLADAEGLAGCHNRLGLIALREKGWAAAEAHLERARERFADLEKPFELAQVEGNLGNLAYAQAAWDRASRHYQRALQRFDALGVVFEKIGILNNLGSVALAREDWTQARRFYQEGLALARELGSRREIRDLLINLGVACLRQGRLDDARRFYAEALPLTRELRDRGGVRDLRRRQVRLALVRGLRWLRAHVTGREDAAGDR
jgi:tetratricopeptide (TPR) repeat protein